MQGALSCKFFVGFARLSYRYFDCRVPPNDEKHESLYISEEVCVGSVSVPQNARSFAVLGARSFHLGASSHLARSPDFGAPVRGGCCMTSLIQINKSDLAL